VISDPDRDTWLRLHSMNTLRQCRQSGPRMPTSVIVWVGLEGNPAPRLVIVRPSLPSAPRRQPDRIGRSWICQLSVNSPSQRSVELTLEVVPLRGAGHLPLNVLMERRNPPSTRKPLRDNRLLGTPRITDGRKMPKRQSFVITNRSFEATNASFVTSNPSFVIRITRFVIRNDRLEREIRFSKPRIVHSKARTTRSSARMQHSCLRTLHSKSRTVHSRSGTTRSWQHPVRSPWRFTILVGCGVQPPRGLVSHVQCARVRAIAAAARDIRAVHRARARSVPHEPPPLTPSSANFSLALVLCGSSSRALR